jgi:ribosomal protein S18 acetylase RimI-like enzyme
MRDAGTGDISFLLQLRRQTMNAYLEKSDMSTSDENHMKRIELAFDAAQIIQINGKDVGLLKCVRGGREWELVQIQLLPELQGTGIGTRVIKELLVEARTSEASVRLSVLKVNPARELYERLGFVVIDENEKSFDMLCSPS